MWGTDNGGGTTTCITFTFPEPTQVSSTWDGGTMTDFPQASSSSTTYSAPTPTLVACTCGSLFVVQNGLTENMKRITLGGANTRKRTIFTKTCQWLRKNATGEGGVFTVLLFRPSFTSWRHLFRLRECICRVIVRWVEDPQRTEFLDNLGRVLYVSECAVECEYKGGRDDARV